MKKYFQSYRRLGNFLQWGIIGALFIVIGILAYFWVNNGNVIWISILIPLGSLLILYSAITCFSRYGSKDKKIYYQKLGFPCQKTFAQVPAIIISIYDEFRPGKGYIPITYSIAEGQEYVALPAITFCREVNEDELDLCDTRVAIDMTLKKKKYIGVLLDFDFLKQLLQDGYTGHIYISKYIYEAYQAGLDRIIIDKTNLSIYDKIPKLHKEEKSK